MGNQSIDQTRRSASYIHRHRRQETIITNSESPAPIMEPIRTPTIVFCKNAMCSARLLITDQDFKKGDFVQCHLCGTPYPLWRKMEPQEAARKRNKNK